MARPASEATTTQARTEGTQTPTVRWETSNLNSAYANVCNVTSTREEVVLNFGINKAWERGAQELEIELTNRLILSPFAAKRLALMLNKLINEYESRYGKLEIPHHGQQHHDHRHGKNFQCKGPFAAFAPWVRDFVLDLARNSDKVNPNGNISVTLVDETDIRPSRRG